MKVLLLNGSHHQNGNTALALEEAAKALEAEGVETELFQIGAGAIQDCIDCGKKKKKKGRLIHLPNLFLFKIFF